MTQKIFENTFPNSTVFVSPLMMAGLPLGAALSVSHNRFMDRHAPFLQAAGLCWGVAVSAAAIPYCGFVKTNGCMELLIQGTILSRLPSWAYLEGILSIVGWFPLWMACGANELVLYRSLRAFSPRAQIGSYVAGLLGVGGGLWVAAYGLPVPSPRWVGLVSLVTLCVYGMVSGGRSRRALFAALVPLALLVWHHDLYVKPPQRTWMGSQDVVYDAWTRSGRFTLTRGGECAGADTYAGFYNTIRHWSAFVGEADDVSRSFAMPAGARIAVLGAGGGAQVANFLRDHPERIYAVEVVPGVLEQLRSLGVAGLADPHVQLVTQDARAFIRDSGLLFDLIELPHTESVPRLGLLEPADHLFTLEAFQLYAQHLAPHGILVIQKLAVLGKGELGHNLFRTLEAAGLSVTYQESGQVIQLVAAHRPAVLESLERTFSPARTRVQPAHLGRVITDDRPFLGSAATAFNPLGILMRIWIGVSGFIGIVFWRTQRSWAGSGVVGPLLCGMTGTLLLLAMQLLLFFRLQHPLEAMPLGALLSVGCATAGAVAWRRWSARLLLALGSAAGLHILGAPSPLALAAAMNVWGGGFFPALLVRYAGALPRLLVLDGLGAVVAGGLFLVVPAMWGIKIFLGMTAGVWLATWWSVVVNSSSGRLPSLSSTRGVGSC